MTSTTDKLSDEVIADLREKNDGIDPHASLNDVLRGGAKRPVGRLRLKTGTVLKVVLISAGILSVYGASKLKDTLLSGRDGQALPENNLLMPPGADVVKFKYGDGVTCYAQKIGERILIYTDINSVDVDSGELGQIDEGDLYANEATFTERLEALEAQHPKFLDLVPDLVTAN